MFFPTTIDVIDVMVFFQNLAINTGIALGMVFLLKQELKGNDKDKEQISEFRDLLKNATERVKKMSNMKVSIKSKASSTGNNARGFTDSDVGLDTRTTTLKDFRAGDASSGSRRVVILAGNAKFIVDSLRNAKKADAKGVSIGVSKFSKERVSIVPVVMADPNSNVIQMPKIGGKNQLE